VVLWFRALNGARLDAQQVVGLYARLHAVWEPRLWQKSCRDAGLVHTFELH
jgi:hypothetical protein